MQRDCAPKLPAEAKECWPLLKEGDDLSYGLEEDDHRGRQATLEPDLEHLGVRRLHLAIVAACMVTNLTPAAIAGAVPYIKSELAHEFGVSTTQTALITTGSIWASVVGSVAFGRMGDAFGRKCTILVCTALALVLVLLQLACRGAPGFWLLVALQTLLGLPKGGLQAIVVPYLLEFCSNGSRGMLGSMVNVGWVFGNIYCILLVRVVGEENWQLCLQAAVIPCVLLLLCVPLLPESPRWLNAAGKQEEAMRVLRLLRDSPAVGAAGAGAKAEPEKRPTALQAQAQVPAALAPPQKQVARVLRELASPELRFDTLTVFALFACAGAQGFSFWAYGPDLVEAATGQKPPLWTFLGTEFVGLSSTMFAAAASDSVGRKPLLVLGNVIGLLVLTMLLLRPSPAVGCLSWLMVGCCNSLVWTIVPVYAGEVFPTRLRATLGGTGLMCSMVVGGLTPLLIGALLARSLPLALGAIAVPLLAGLLLAVFAVRETARTAIVA